MTDVLRPIDAAAAWAQIEAEQAARAACLAEALPLTKAALFDALAAAAICHVVVVFDGVGDSGQIDSVDAFRAGELVELPAVDIEVVTPLYDGSGLDRELQPLSGAIETLAYELLEQTHGGWEINEGAFGEFTFDVAARTIQLDYNERIETSELHEHSW